MRNSEVPRQARPSVDQDPHIQQNDTRGGFSLDQMRDSLCMRSMRESTVPALVSGVFRALVLIVVCREAAAQDFKAWLEKDRAALKTFLDGKGAPAVARDRGTTSVWSYGYFYHDDLIDLAASTRMVAVRGRRNTLVRRSGDLARSGLRIHSLSHRQSLSERELVILHATEGSVAFSCHDSPVWIAEVADQLQQVLGVRDAALDVQPVFPLHESLLIPNDEVIVSFDRALTRRDVLNVLAPVRDRLGLLDIQSLRASSWIVKIRGSQRGRNHAVSRALSQVEGIRAAEPNHELVRLYGRPPAVTPALTSEENVLLNLLSSINADATAREMTDNGWDVLGSPW